jgi:predicted HAD superfamily phosphohydrolase YqeG
MHPSPLDRLKALISVTGTFNEVECGEVLATHFAGVLLPFDETIVLVDKQYSTEWISSSLVII